MIIFIFILLRSRSCTRREIVLWKRRRSSWAQIESWSKKSHWKFSDFLFQFNTRTARFAFSMLLLRRIKRHPKIEIITLLIQELILLFPICYIWFLQERGRLSLELFLSVSFVQLTKKYAPKEERKELYCFVAHLINL